MVGHHDKPQAQAISECEFRTEMSNDNSFGTIRVKKSTTAIAGERDKVDVFFVIVNHPFDHRSVALLQFLPVMGIVD